MVRYKSKKGCWYVFALEDGKMVKKKISALEVPFWKGRVQRRKTFVCGACGTRAISFEKHPDCPSCGFSMVLTQHDKIPDASGTYLKPKRSLSVTPWLTRK